ncbi:uncharacterized protein Z518_08221 [Rhinocladiella mackenziei CBS 650.93]|uniref:N-acetyltransferase domain-containing protein n=1 Tax=Rhinocladiella mackenziei CBS 650.93 TaxID=1442369 RepID=A0A0D2FJX9_9EURO|nr:uncharacterized protein Z518_08221 [Rhinocladiella mackenziei CBS 650.93]KIX02282.1 hypothetical protein Z518_08221 [Rhinocladiella mackenziei CBS 650.93]
MSSTSPLLPYTPISPTSTGDLNHFINIITDAFSETALTTAFIADIDGTKPPYPSPSIDSARRFRHFSQGILDSAASNAELVQAGNWSVIALWEPPTYVGKAFIDSRTRPGELLAEWREKVKAAKARCLGLASSKTSIASDSPSPESEDTRPEVEFEPGPQLRPFYHLSFLARNPSAPRVEGSINAVMTPFLERARAENVPAWLEATTRQAVRVYEHFGFRVVEGIVVGQGKVDAGGWPTQDGSGEGVTAWAMIFDGHLRD